MGCSVMVAGGAMAAPGAMVCTEYCFTPAGVVVYARYRGRDVLFTKVSWDRPEVICKGGGLH
jgi:hypothetical protein